jgi:Ca-activated chloride channel family protein
MVRSRGETRRGWRFAPLRRLVAGLFLVALLGMVVGCGGTPPATVSTEENTTVPPPKDPPDDAVSAAAKLSPAVDELGVEKGDTTRGRDYAMTTETIPGQPVPGNRRVFSPMGPQGQIVPGYVGGTGFERRAGRTVKSSGDRDDYNRQNAEVYGRYLENPFRSPRVAPVSTLSADVNTASYSNVRRFLTQGQLPPKDAVFLAELVNYFPFRYPKPTGADPVSFTTELARCPWEPAHYLARVGVQARQIDPAAMPPRNLVFLVDTSGSMSAENRLPLVKKSLELLIDRLAPHDRVTLVTYAGTAGIALHPTPGSQKDVIRAAVRGLGAGGSTNGEGGIRAAYDAATASLIPGGVNRVILCTDGDFNVGVTNKGDLIRMIEEKRRSGVFLTVLGFGMGNYKDDTLKELANHGNGHHAYIDTLDEAKKVFVEQGGALAVVAKDVKLQVEFNPARVAAYRLIGYENRLLKAEDFKDDARDAGDMGSGHTVTAFYEVVPVGVSISLPEPDGLKYQEVKPKENATREWLTVRMRYKEPEGAVSRELSSALPEGAGADPMSEDFRFAAAVVEFGQLLRDSPYKGSASLTTVLERAERSATFDPNGHRAEFIQLVKKAQQLRTEGEKDAGAK